MVFTGVFMWIQFIECFALAATMLIVPGCLILSSFHIPLIHALGFASAVSTAWYIFAGILFDVLGIRATAALMIAPLLSVSLIMFLVALVQRKRLNFRARDDDGFSLTSIKGARSDIIIIVSTLIICLALGILIFVKQLNGANSFVQTNDNGFHFSLIKCLASNGTYSVLKSSAYLNVDFVAPVSESGFYPAAWHCLAALLTSAFDVTPMLAANALNTLISFVLFPMGMLSLLYELFKDNRRLLCFAPVLILSFQALPWWFLDFGPLFSNLSAYAIVPIFLTAFIKATRGLVDSTIRIPYIAMSVISLIDMAFMQPNAVFTSGVILVPFCVEQLWVNTFSKSDKKRSRVFRACVVAGFLIFVVVVWAFFLNATFMQGVVSFTWSAFLSKRQALVNVLLGAFSSDYAQPALALLVLIGIAYSLHNKGDRWLIASYFFIVLQYFVCAASDGTLKHILAGFWYTDSHRIAASLVFVGVPLACMGAYGAYRVAAKFYCFVMDTHKWNVSRISVLSFAVVLIALIYYPNFMISNQPFATAFGVLEDRFIIGNSDPAERFLSTEEIDFLCEVSEIVSEDAVILNVPFDGSAYAYPMLGMNVYYRYFGLNNGADSDTSIELRLHVDDWESDPDVAQALDDANVQYVLLLDEGDNTEETETYRSLSHGSTREEDFAGLYNISEEHAPGFVEVLRDGDMVLYEIQN